MSKSQIIWLPHLAFDEIWFSTLSGIKPIISKEEDNVSECVGKTKLTIFWVCATLNYSSLIFCSKKEEFVSDKTLQASLIPSKAVAYICSTIRVGS